MKRIAKFYKVSFEQFKKDWLNVFPRYDVNSIEQIYEKIKLPSRGTIGSAGYDFYSPIDIILSPKGCIKIPTGIRAYMEEGWVLKCYPRSGLGFKFRLQLDNTVGIIDEDYFYSSNEGHIMAKITNDTYEDKCISIKSSAGFMQGIFEEYGITFDDEASDKRDGGFGSTTKL